MHENKYNSFGAITPIFNLSTFKVYIRVHTEKCLLQQNCYTLSLRTSQEEKIPLSRKVTRNFTLTILNFRQKPGQYVHFTIAIAHTLIHNHISTIIGYVTNIFLPLFIFKLVQLLRSEAIVLPPNSVFRPKCFHSV